MTADHDRAARLDRTAAERQRRRRQKAKLERELRFVRQDWALFLHPDRLAQKAGAPVRRLRRMALKELTDNAADVSVEVELEQLEADTYRVGDRGPGLDGAQVAALFAVDRPLVSGKLLRRPTRGAVGNGLRVVTGAAIGSGGELIVESRGRRWRVAVDLTTGATRAIDLGPSGQTTGTAITLRFGPGLPPDSDALAWAQVAAALAGPAARPLHSHPSWYNEAAWHELVHAAHGATAGDLLTRFGVESDDARPAHALTLMEARAAAGDVPEPALLPIAADAFPGQHASWHGRFGNGAPVLIQAWAICERAAGRHGLELTLVLNRTQGASELFGAFDAEGAYLKGCGLRHIVPKVSRARYQLWLAVTAPFIPMVTDGKEPDLSELAGPITQTAAGAIRKSYAATRRRGGMTQKAAAFEVMAEAYRLASANHTLPANARQIMYAARRFILKACGLERLDDDYFTQVLLPAYLEAHPEETADWDVVYDARGHLIEPHTGASLPLGTVQVRDYLRPRPAGNGAGSLVRCDGGLWAGPVTDRYRTVLFVEKEGFEPLLRAARIAERFDCAIMSTKGMSVTAARALLDRLSREGVRILVAHDFDRSGFSIFGTLRASTRRYRYAQVPDVVDLGLRLADCRAMDLQDEEAPPLPAGTDRGKVARTLRLHGATPEEIEFLVQRGRRVELNAMTSDQFVAWLEAGLRRHGAGKVVPADRVIEAAWREAVARQHVQGRARILEQEARALAASVDVPEGMAEAVRHEIEGSDLSWDEAVARIVSRQRRTR